MKREGVTGCHNLRKPCSQHQERMQGVCVALLAAAAAVASPALAFAPAPAAYSARSRTSLSAEKETCTIQVLMSDTGGGHRASANALRDAFNVLHETEPAQFPLPIHCDIVDIYTVREEMTK